MNTQLLVIITIFLAVFLHSLDRAFSADFTGQVIGVVDGDSIRVLHNHQPQQIRLAGIDCPERKQAFGTRAKQVTSTLSFGKEVTVRPLTKDPYNRTVAVVSMPDGVILNEELVR